MSGEAHGPGNVIADLELAIIITERLPISVSEHLRDLHCSSIGHRQQRREKIHNEEKTRDERLPGARHLEADGGRNESDQDAMMNRSQSVSRHTVVWS